jgi:hypothetical protein
VRSTTIEILGSFGTRERSVQETKNTKNKKSQQPPRLVLAPAAFYYGQLDCAEFCAHHRALPSATGA